MYVSKRQIVIYFIHRCASVATVYTWNNCVKYCLKNDSAALSSLSRSVVKWYCLDARLCSLRWCLPCDVEWQHESYYVNEEPANSSPLQETSMTMRGPQQQPNHIN